MNNKITHIISAFFIVLCLFSSSVQQEKTTILQNSIKESEAGKPITLSFFSKEKEIALFCSNSYSTTILYPETESNTYKFIIPEHIYRKTGILRWKLIHNGNILLQNTIHIIPSKTETIMEAYFGPPSIIAGGRDYAMLVVTPSDGFDNPIAENTPVIISHQFLDIIKHENLQTKNLIAWQNIFSYETSGRILVNAVCNNISSKEITTEVYPDNAVDFTISSERFHDFADGNQIATFTSSIIRDQFGNVVSDGTHVNFLIEISNGTLLKVAGNTVNGVAKAKMIHPYKEEVWKISAYVDGLADSNQIEISFQQLFDDFNVSFSKNYRNITIGPLKSFMNQLIPNGFPVFLKIYKNTALIETKEMETTSGLATFTLQSDFYPEGTYTFEIATGGNSQTFENIQLTK